MKKRFAQATCELKNRLSETRIAGEKAMGAFITERREGHYE